MPCLQVKRLLRRRSRREVTVSHRAQTPSAQCRKEDFWQPSKRCQERQPVSGPSRSQITTRVKRKFLIDVVLWSTRSSGTSRVLWCASPVGCMCVITSRMHAVCDERGNYLFKSVGSLADRPSPWQGRNRQSERWTSEITWGSSTCVYMGCSARKPCGHCPHSVLRPFQFPSGRQCRWCDFGDQEAGQTGITLTDDREWKRMCYICMTASNSWLPCSTLSWTASLIPRSKFNFE